MPKGGNKKKSVDAKNARHFYAYGNYRSLHSEGMKFPQVSIFRIKELFKIQNLESPRDKNYKTVCSELYLTYGFVPT